MKPANLLIKRRSPTIVDADKSPFIMVNSFDEEAVENFLIAMTKAQANPENTVIPVIINSYGGEAYALFAMVDIIRSSTIPVATIALGKAMSCGAALLAAGTKGYRFIAPSADIMIHEVSSKFSGKTADFINESKTMENLNKRYFEVLDTSSGHKSGFFQKLVKKSHNVDLTVSPQSAVKYGLVDYVGVPKIFEE